MARILPPRSATATPDRIVWWLAAFFLSLAVAASAGAQQSDPTAPQEVPQSGVLPAPKVDPEIHVDPPVPPTALPTPVIPPPGTPGGDPNVIPK